LACKWSEKACRLVAVVVILDGVFLFVSIIVSVFSLFLWQDENNAM
jgi:hypothetical protein